MRGTKQVGIWSEMGSLWQPHPTQDQPAPPGGFEIDPRIGLAATRAPAASKVDSCPQAILKFHRLSSLDYRVRHELPVGKTLKVLSFSSNTGDSPRLDWCSIFFQVDLKTFFVILNKQGLTWKNQQCKLNLCIIELARYLNCKN